MRQSDKWYQWDYEVGLRDKWYQRNYMRWDSETNGTSGTMRWDCETSVTNQWDFIYLYLIVIANPELYVKTYDQKIN